MSFASNMDRPEDYHTKWSKPNRERQIMHGTLICGNKNKSQTHRNNRKMVVNRK